MAGELSGTKELTKKLGQLDAKLQVKALRSVLFKATTPTLQQMKSRVPVGTRASRTYKKRLVAPGFAKRSIKRVTGKKFLSRGLLSIAIGVRAEAWYAVHLLDQGPYTITERRDRSAYSAKSKRQIKPYTLPRRAWFEQTFRANQGRMLAGITANLKQQIEKIANG